MDVLVQALIMGITQGLTEFLPVSSSGHLILVPYLLGFHDPFIDSLAFTVMLHMGTLVALLVYFRQDWLRLVPAGLAAMRDRSFRGDPDRRLAWLLVAATIPAVVAGVLLNDVIESAFHDPSTAPRYVAITLVIGGVILWLADRTGRHVRREGDISFPVAFGIGVAQAIALVPGISRSGISIAAGLLAGLSREAAARFSFLMATPVVAGAGAWEALKIVRGEAPGEVSAGVLVVGVGAALVSGLVAIEVTLRFLRTHSVNLFVAYRIVLALVVAILWLNLWGR